MRFPDTRADRNALPLAGLRIAVGCLFLIVGRYKVFGSQFTLHGGFQWWINKFLQDGAAYPFMVPVLNRLVLPYARPIAFLVAYGEFAIGLALVLGICVRIASTFVVLVQLSRYARFALAIFRGFIRSFCACPMPSHVRCWPERLGFICKKVPA